MIHKFENIRYNINIQHIYLDGILFHETTFEINDDLIEFIFPMNDYDISLYRQSGLFANLFIGKYDPIWTDEFIQEVYNARKPFSVPSRAITI